MDHLRKSAFTLIEMLLVVALISLLISLLLPALSRSKHAAQTAVCASNLSQIYKATVSYATYNRNLLPAARRTAATGTDPEIKAWVNGNWTDINAVLNGTLYDDMGKNKEAYICPVFLQTRSRWNSNPTTVAFSYSLNEYSGNSWKGKNGVRSIKRAEEPDKLFLFGDENAWIVQGYSTYTINNGAMGVGQYQLPSDIVDCIGSFHYPPNGNLDDGSGNVLFFDGHVGLTHVSQTKEVVTPRRYKF